MDPGVSLPETAPPPQLRAATVLTADGAAPAFLLNQPAGAPERRRAGIVLCISVFLFAALAPFSRVQLPAIFAFVPLYTAALVINDLFTAVLLFGQYRILRSRALMMLASGYLFAALMTCVQSLTFPGLFSETGLLGAGPQTSAATYVFWHAAFPLFVLSYCYLRRREPQISGAPAASFALRPGRDLVAFAFPAMAIILAVAFSAWSTVGQASLLTFTEGGRFTVTLTVCAAAIWVLSLIAVAVLWHQRPHSILDLWLTVSLTTFSFDVALSSMLNGARFDVGYYAGRIYGL